MSELAKTLSSFKRELAVVLAFGIATNLLMLAPALYMLQVFDRVMASQSELTLLAVSLLTLFLLSLLAVAEWLRSQLLVRVGARLDASLNARVFAASFEAALARTGGNPTRGLSDLATVRQFLAGSGTFALFDAPWTPIYLAVLFILHPLIGAAATVFSLALAAAIVLGYLLSREPNARVLQSTAAIDTYLHGKLRNAEVIQALGMLDHLRARWSVHQGRLLDASTQAQERQQLAQAMTKFLRYAEQALMLGIGALLVLEGEMTVGGMIAANVLMARALAPIDQMTAGWKGFVAARAAWHSLGALLQENPPRADRGAHAPPAGRVTLQELGAAAGERQILRGLQAEIAPGEAIAIIGPSGAGKTTLARALLGIWPQVQGRVLLDGAPLEAWDRGELGPHLGYLPQDIEMLEGTIAENIARFGELDSEKVVEAARRTGIHDMVLRFPAGYDTPVGEAGSALSGGQRQRIALARALYGSPALVVLDEPDSNLDDAGVAALADTLKQLKRMNKTVVMITHRMSLVGAVDRILLLAGGSIRMYGPRADVVAALRSA